MSAVKTDYYALLGVTPDADEEAIRAAFEAAARDCRPEVAKTRGARRRYRKLAEAYDVLSKPASRLLYDLGYRPGSGSDPDDDGASGSAESPGQGPDVYAELVLGPSELRRGVSRVVEFEAVGPCPACGPDGADPDCAECGGEGIVAARRRVRVRVPPGAEDGSQLRVAGEGHAPGGSVPPGDLLLDVLVAPGPRDSRVVRYVALALFVAAVAILIVYLLSA